jgi:hypothetical protein
MGVGVFTGLYLFVRVLISGWRQWLMPVILAIQKVEMGRTGVQGQHGQKSP